MISRQEVEHVARLARLHLTNGEIERLQHELSRILDYFQQLHDLDLSGLPPTAHAADLRNVFRPDVPRPGVSQDEALAGVPEVEEGQFLVPRIG